MKLKDHKAKCITDLGTLAVRGIFLMVTLFLIPYYPLFHPYSCHAETCPISTDFG